MANSYNGVLVSNKKEWMTNQCNDLDESQKQFEWKKPDTKENILNDSFYMKFKKRQNNSMVIENRTVVVYGERRLAGRGHKGIFKSDGNVLYLDWGFDYLVVYIYQKSSNFSLKNLYISLILP